MDYGERFEFNYAKVTLLVINTFGLENTVKEWMINISASYKEYAPLRSLLEQHRWPSSLKENVLIPYR